MKKLAGLFNLELKKTLRTPIIMFFSILAPQFFLFVQSSASDSVLVGNQTIAAIDYSFPMFLYLAVIVIGVGNVGVGMAYNRLIKFFSRLKVSNVRSFDFIMANFFVQLLIVLVSTILLITTSVTTQDMTIKGRNWLLFISVFLLVWLMTYLIGIIIANLTKDAKTSQSVSLVIYFALIFFSGVTYPTELLPDVLRKISEALPTYHGLKLLQEAWYSNGSALSMNHLVIVVLSTVVFLGLSIKMFKFD